MRRDFVTSRTVDGVEYRYEERRAYSFVKRVFDLIVSMLFLVLFFWVFLAIAIAIKLDDGGPVFYISNRVGRFGKEFRFYKFRSMNADAEDQIKDLEKYNEQSGHLFKIKESVHVSSRQRSTRMTGLCAVNSCYDTLTYLGSS